MANKQKFQCRLCTATVWFCILQRPYLNEIRMVRFQQHRISESYSKFYWCLRPDLLTEN